MSFDPITHADGTKYDSMIPEIVKVEAGIMPEITFTDHDGDQINLMLHKRQVLALRDRLTEVIEFETRS